MMRQSRARCQASCPRRSASRAFDKPSQAARGRCRGGDAVLLHNRGMENWFSPELVALIQEAEQPYAYIALLMIVAAFPIAWAVPRLLRGPVPRVGSIIFGRTIFDG